MLEGQDVHVAQHLGLTPPLLFAHGSEDCQELIGGKWGPGKGTWNTPPDSKLIRPHQLTQMFYSF
jgi:hypothetical protein